jgi:integrase
MEYLGVTTLVTEIGFKEIESFTTRCERSPKTIYETLRCIRELLTWAYRRGDLPKMPRFPRYSVAANDMQMRDTVTKEEQVTILEKIRENEWERAPRKYIACKMLATYVNIRPGELREVKERDYDRDTGVLTIRHHKTSRTTPKVVKLLDSDRGLIQGLPRGLPEQPLFRYDESYNTVLAGSPFGVGALYRCWKRAAISVGHGGVDLYGGTRHSSCIALYKEVGLSPEEIRRASGTRTSRAFMRYLPLDVEDIAKIHGMAEPGRGE